MGPCRLGFCRSMILTLNNKEDIMEEDTKIEEVKKVGKSTKTVAHDNFDAQDQARVPANKDHFDNIMGHGKEKVEPSQKIDPMSQSSLMEEVRNLSNKTDRVTKVEPTQLVAQADEVINQIESIKKKLATPNLEIKPNTQTLLQNKLSHIDENLRVALSKAGVEYTPAPHAENKLVNPIDRFLGFLTHGQEQLKSLSGEVELMHLNNKEITPANMLRIQMKVGYVQQEIEFFTAVLNKALESTKTIMNVQV